MGIVITISQAEMKNTFHDILIKNGMNDQKSMQCAEIFTANSLDGVYTHGVNRFPRFIEYIRKGYIKIDAEPVLKNKIGSIEQWDGQLGPGPIECTTGYNKSHATRFRKWIGMCSARQYQSLDAWWYIWLVCRAKRICIYRMDEYYCKHACLGAIDCKLGNNPLVIALPYNEEAIVMDMAMSQFSFGAILAIMKNEKLPQPGGYDKQGNLTNDPSAIMQSKRSLPVGYWKARIIIAA